MDPGLRDRVGLFLTEPPDENGSAIVRERIAQCLTGAPAWDFGSEGSGSESLRVRRDGDPRVDQDVEAVPPGTESAR